MRGFLIRFRRLSEGGRKTPSSGTIKKRALPPLSGISFYGC